MSAATTEVNPWDPELVADPYTGYGRFREQAPVLRGVYMDGTPAWYVTRFEDVRRLLGDPRFVSDATSVSRGGTTSVQLRAMSAMGVPAELMPYLAGSLLFRDPPTHSRLRQLVSRTFTARRVTGLRPRITAVVDGLLDRVEQGGPADLIGGLAEPLSATVICELVGIPDGDRPAWQEWSTALVTNDTERMGTALAGIVEYVHALIGTRRATPSDDLLTGLIRAHDAEDDALSDVELVATVLTLVIAGLETTAHQLGNAVVAFLTHRDQLALVEADPELWPGAFTELVRWCGPVLLGELRYAAVDLDLCGTAVRAGDPVQPVLVAANHDPRAFPEPNRFDVTRTARAQLGSGHLGFGHATHYCLGAALARQEIEIALGALFGRFPDLALAVAASELPWQPVPGARRLAALPVRT